MKQYLRIKQLSNITSVSYSTINHWIKQGIIKSVKIGSVVLIPIEELKKLGIQIKEEDKHNER
jgi:excisionase family DNA binding protein